mgnify:CR=1 FL=1
MTDKQGLVGKLKEKAHLARKEILETITEAQSGHPGGSLSCIDILISLYFYKMKHKPDVPQWDERDRLIISKGHASPAAYVALANAGYFPKEELKTFRKLGARLQGHVHTKVPGVEFCTGSLGQGLSVTNGLGIGAKIGKAGYNVYCLMGDGEIQEGMVWEAAMTASHHKLDNVCAILDYNKLQENGLVNSIKNEEPQNGRWSSFGWHVIEVDGHNFEELMNALDEFETVKGKPTIIIAHTIKGKGISFMEGNHKWHGKSPNQEQLSDALAELGY